MSGVLLYEHIENHSDIRQYWIFEYSGYLPRNHLLSLPKSSCQNHNNIGSSVSEIAMSETSHKQPAQPDSKGGCLLWSNLSFSEWGPPSNFFHPLIKAEGSGIDKVEKKKKRKGSR